MLHHLLEGDILFGKYSSERQCGSDVALSQS